MIKRFRLKYYLMRKDYTVNEIYKIEREVAQIYYSDINRKCLIEKSELNQLKYSLRREKISTRKENLKRRIKNYSLDNCSMLKEMRSVMGYN